MADEGPVFDFIARYVGGRRARGEITAITASNQRRTLVTFGRSYGRRPMNRLSRTDVERWLAEGGSSFTPATQRTRLSIVRGFAQWLVREGVIKKDPTADVAKVRQPRTVPVTFSPDDVATLLDACPDSRARLIVLLLFQEALRCVEVSRLELGHIEGERMLVTGKGGHQRTLFLVHEVQEELAAYLREERGGRAGPLITNRLRPGLPLKPNTVSLFVNGWIRAAGLKHYAYDGRSAHGGRRTAACDMLDNGATIEQVAEVLGHENWSTTRRYAKVNPSRLKSAMSGRWYGRGRVIQLDSTG